MVRCPVATVFILALAVPVVVYRPPVDAPVIDPFRAPASPYGPGNRGVDYGTAPGTVVRASASGVVLFAGPVGGRLHVTIGHADGRRTSYSSLASVDVARGQPISAGAAVGRTDGSFHFGVREDARYVDPLDLFADESAVALVPDAIEGPGSESVASIAAAWSSLRRVVPAAALGEPWRHYALALRAEPRLLAVLERGVRWWRARTPCTPPDEPTPTPTGGRRVAVLVGGLGSSSAEAAIDRLDTDALGYDPTDVVRFSYRGGAVGSAAPSPLASLAGDRYGAADTHEPLEVSAARLRAMLHALAVAVPDVPVDVIAHSQGGVVARLALVDDGSGPPPGAVEHLVTLGSPHDGADLATAAQAVEATSSRAGLVRGLSRAAGLEIDPGTPAVADLAETSPVVAHLAVADLVPGVAIRSIAARGDLVVPVPRTDLPDASAVVVPLTGATAHEELVADPRALREVALALSERPPTCETLADVLLDGATGEAVSWSEDLLGAALAAPP
jgi:hypothetical protein